MSEQLVFELPAKAALGREAFLVAPSNAHAVKRLEDVARWPGNMMILVGPPGSGKSHLAHIWLAENPDGVVVEDVDQIAGDRAAETDLFHRFNDWRAAETLVLMTAQLPPVHTDWGLPDLASRLQSLDLAQIEEPDDQLLAVMLVKLFSDRQLAVKPELVTYLVARMPRSASAARDIVARLDKRALQTGRAPSRALAAQVLDML